VSLAVKPVGKPDAGNSHVRFDERGWETGRRLASALAPILDSTAVLEATLEQLTGGLPAGYGLIVGRPGQDVLRREVPLARAITPLGSV